MMYALAAKTLAIPNASPRARSKQAVADRILATATLTGRLTKIRP
jgi:hypothetical protein